MLVLICLIKFWRFFQNVCSHLLQKHWFCLCPPNLYNSHFGGCEVISDCFMISFYEMSSQYVTHTGLQLTNLLSQLAKSGDYQWVPATSFIMFWFAFSRLVVVVSIGHVLLGYLHMFFECLTKGLLPLSKIGIFALSHNGQVLLCFGHWRLIRHTVWQYILSSNWTSFHSAEFFP